MNSNNLALAVAGAFCWAAAPEGAVMVTRHIKSGCDRTQHHTLHLPLKGTMGGESQEAVNEQINVVVKEESKRTRKRLPL